jgi:hypothetical protein
MREMLTAAMGVNLSLVTINQGEVVKKLAGWAALAGGADADHKLVRHELPQHARAARPLQLLHPDRGRGARVPACIATAQGAMAYSARPASRKRGI